MHDLACRLPHGLIFIVSLPVLHGSFRHAERDPAVILAVAAPLNQGVVAFEREVVISFRGTVDVQGGGEAWYKARGFGAKTIDARRHAGGEPALRIGPGAFDLFPARPAFEHSDD